jgi:hypothetical protein
LNDLLLGRQAESVGHVDAGASVLVGHVLTHPLEEAYRDLLDD